MNEWISVKDSVPEDGNCMCSSCSNNVLVWTDCCDTNDDASIGWWCYEDNRCIWDTHQGLEDGENVTHWMPLPEPPNE